MPRLDDKLVASKAVDIQKGLQDVSYSLAHYHFKKTVRVAKMIRLAANIQGFEVIRPVDRLEIMALELGIDPDSLKSSILPSMEDIGLVEIHRDNSGDIDRVEESIPRVGELLESTGRYWTETDPSPIESAGISSLDKTSITPLPLAKMRTDLSELKDNEFQILLDCGKSGKFLDDYVSSSGETIVYSPTIWGHRADDVLKFYGKLSSESRAVLENLIGRVRTYPGTPIEWVLDSGPMLGQALGSGFLEKASTVTEKGKTNDFLYFPTPKFKLKSSGLPDPFDKVRAVISSVRRGEHYAEITRIRNPALLLQRLLERGSLNPHSEARDQYGTVEIQGVIRTEKQGGLWKPFLIPTEENREIIRTAIEVISQGEDFSGRLIDKEARSLLMTGSFIGPMRNRARTRDAPVVSEASFKDMMERFRGEKFER